MPVYRVGWFGALLLVLVQLAFSMKEYLSSFHTSLYLYKLLYFWSIILAVTLTEVPNF